MGAGFGTPLFYIILSMTRKERYERILAYFAAKQPMVTTELQFGSAFQLLVATLLSAQCTDKRINQVTPALFARYPSAREMAAAEPEILAMVSAFVLFVESAAR